MDLANFAWDLPCSHRFEMHIHISGIMYGIDYHHSSCYVEDMALVLSMSRQHAILHDRTP